MFNEVKAEISELVHDVVFVRNLSVTLLAAIAIFSGLAELQSQSLISDRQSIVNISNSSSMNIVVKRK